MSKQAKPRYRKSTVSSKSLKSKRSTLAGVNMAGETALTGAGGHGNLAFLLSIGGDRHKKGKSVPISAALLTLSVPPTTIYYNIHNHVEILHKRGKFVLSTYSVEIFGSTF